MTHIFQMGGFNQQLVIHLLSTMGPHPCRLGQFCFPCFRLFEARCVSLPLQIRWDFSRSLWCFRPGDISALLLGFQTLTVTWAVLGKHHRFLGSNLKNNPKNMPKNSQEITTPKPPHILPRYSCIYHLIQKRCIGVPSVYTSSHM